MTTADITLCDVCGGAAWITMNRPENRNAISLELIASLYDHLRACNANDGVRSIVITGTGPAFCAGADLKGSRTDPSIRTVTFVDLLNAILESPKPIIAAVNGVAFGGGLGLVAASDIVIANKDAQFSFSEVRIGVIPAIISVVCLPKLGRHQAMKLFLTGERFDGQAAVQMGLAHTAVDGDELVDAVDDVTNMIAQGGPNAVVECKKLVRRVSELPLQQGFEATEEWSARMFRTEEAAEGMAAFRERRKPNWVSDE